MKSAPVEQRWVRPHDLKPGDLKKLLATKYLKIAARGDLPGLRRLLSEYPEFLNKTGPHNRTLLWEAARKGRFEAVKFLVDNGAKLDAPGCYNSESRVMITAYCAARYYNRPDIADHLWSKGAKLDIFRAAFLGDRKRVARRLRLKPELIDAEDPADNIYYVPLLAFAVAGGNLQLAGDLIGRSAKFDVYGEQFLDLAARIGRVDLLDLLFASGADARTLGPAVLVDTPDLEIVRLLLGRGAPVNSTGPSGLPALVYLARGDKGERPDKIKAVLQHGADVDAAGPDGRTALHYASAAGFTKVMALLLAQGARVDPVSHEGATPLSLARSAGKAAAVTLLRKYGAR